MGLFLSYFFKLGVEKHNEKEGRRIIAILQLLAILVFVSDKTAPEAIFGQDEYHCNIEGSLAI
jgi:hypothetical protein